METAVWADVIVVGGGISGLLAAGELRARGLRVTLLDKAVRVGGRLATRRIGPGRGDHGAQFFTARSAEFAALVESWQAAGLAYVWATSFGDGRSAPPSDGHARYAVRGGMNELAKHLAGALKPEVSIESNTKALVVEPGADGWQATAENGRVFAARALALTAPVPQSLALLKPGLLATSDHDALSAIVYAPCLAGIFWVQGDVFLPEPGAVQSPDTPVTWIADNRRKGVSPDAAVITVHAGPDYSRTLSSLPEHAALAALEAAVEPYLSPSALVREGQLKAWRYALPTTIYPGAYLLAEGLPPLAFAGDAFGGPRVEGAALSGLAAGRALAACLGAG